MVIFFIENHGFGNDQLFVVRCLARNISAMLMKVKCL